MMYDYYEGNLEPNSAVFDLMKANFKTRLLQKISDGRWHCFVNEVLYNAKSRNAEWEDFKNERLDDNALIGFIYKNSPWKGFASKQSLIESLLSNRSNVGESLEDVFAKVDVFDDFYKFCKPQFGKYSDQVILEVFRELFFTCTKAGGYDFGDVFTGIMSIINRMIHARFDFSLQLSKLIMNFLDKTPKFSSTRNIVHSLLCVVFFGEYFQKAKTRLGISVSDYWLDEALEIALSPPLKLEESNHHDPYYITRAVLSSSCLEPCLKHFGYSDELVISIEMLLETEDIVNDLKHYSSDELKSDLKIAKTQGHKVILKLLKTWKQLL